MMNVNFFVLYIFSVFYIILCQGHEEVTVQWNNDFYKNIFLSDFYVKPLTEKMLKESGLGGLFNIEDKVKFYLFHKNNPNEGQQLIINNVTSLKNSNWIPGLPTKIYVHGYVANSSVSQMVEMRRKFLERKEKMNIIALDWGPVANMFYPLSAHFTEDVGKIGSALIDFLIKNGAKTSDFHIIGLSLGAHVAGFVAKNVKSGKVSRVTGLDAAIAGFLTEGKDGRLDKTDAEFVDCIHTSGGVVGFMKPICHADFYANGGKHPQPGCPDSYSGIGCSHVRSQDLFTESIEEGHQFPALSCQILTKNGPDNCVDEGALMGYPAERKYQGLFYAETGSKYPFAPSVPIESSFFKN